jgi:hypothetical protein
MAKGNGLRYNLTIISRRRRLIDPDNLCVKYAIDALKGIIIEDDDAQHINQFTVRQEKVGKNEKPETVIEIEIL